jgi:branched-chain amino acid transport system ATP-binding protein
MLEVRNLNAFYGNSQILRGLDLTVGQSEIVALLGRNGAGCSTLLKAIMGGVSAEGSIRFQGEELLGLKPYVIANRGIGYVPENREIFPTLTVKQNLLLGVKGKRAGRWNMAKTWSRFPQLLERENALAGVLSGGEQQMLTVCRTMMGDPSIILVDEPTEGLSPQMVGRLRELLLEIAALGTSVLLVEQKLTIALSVSRRVYVMGHGSIVFEGTPASFKETPSVRREWLEV